MPWLGDFQKEIRMEEEAFARMMRIVSNLYEMECEAQRTACLYGNKKQALGRCVIALLEKGATVVEHGGKKHVFTDLGLLVDFYLEHESEMFQ